MKIPLNSYPITGVVYASDGSTKYPDVTVTVRNTTKNTWDKTTTESDGSFSIDLANFSGGYSNGDSLKIEAELGSFYQYTTSTVNTSLSGLDFSLTLTTETINRIIDKSRLMGELVEFFRQRLTDPNNRGTIETTIQSGTGSKVKFTLPRASINCMYSILVNNTIQSNYTEYYVDYKDRNPNDYPIVYFLTPPSNLATVEFTYCYGTSWIYPDVPKIDMKLGSYPRVSIRLLGFRTTEGGLGALSNITDMLGTVDIYSSMESELEDLVRDIRTLILQNKKNFNYFNLIIPQGTGPVLVSPSREERILQQNQDFMIGWRLEVI